MELVLQQHLPHQQKAVDAVIDVFKGVNMTAPVQFFENPAFLLDDKQLWKNIETLQRNIPQEYRSNGFEVPERRMSTRKRFLKCIRNMDLISLSLPFLRWRLRPVLNSF